MVSQLQKPELEQPRIGSRGLSIFAQGMNAEILRAHSARPLRCCELEGAIGWASPSTLRVAVGRLCEVGALVRTDSSPGSQGVTELTAAGAELLLVGEALEEWLADSPEGALTLDEQAASGVIRVLAAGWDATMFRTLAERPRGLRELDAAIPQISYQGLKRRLAKLRATRLVVPMGVGKGTTYSVSDWLRRAATPIILAGRWELRHEPGEVAPLPTEIETAFLLLVPLLELPAAASGWCTLAALVPADASWTGEPEVAGVAVRLEQGKVTSCVPHAGAHAPIWALGSVAQWFDAVVDGNYEGLRFGGARPLLSQRLVREIHERLFGSARFAGLGAEVQPA